MSWLREGIGASVLGENKGDRGGQAFGELDVHELVRPAQLRDLGEGG